MKKLAITLVVLLAAINSYALTEGFEGSSYDTYADTGSSAGVSTEQYHAGSQSMKLFLGGDSQYARVHLNFSGIQLSEINANWWAYVDGSSARSDLAPYVMFAVDCDKNGTYEYGADKDALIIEFGSSSPTALNEWHEYSLNPSTTYHIVGNRTGLTSGTFDASGTQDTLSVLNSIDYDSNTKWGDLDIVGMRLAAGNWPNSGEYTAYVDDLSVVPEPATMVILGLGGLGLLRKKRA